MSLKPPNKLGARQHDLLIDLGYEPKGFQGGGHYRYNHPEQPAVFVSGTSYDGAAWQAFVSSMRRRHPDYFRPQRSSRSKRAPQQRLVLVRTLINQAVRETEEQPEPVKRLGYTGCPNCERPWLSDINPHGRLCPACQTPIEVAA